MIKDFKFECILVARNDNIVVFNGKIFDLNKLEKLSDFLWDASESKADAMLGYEDAAMETYWELRDFMRILKEIPDDKTQHALFMEHRLDQELWKMEDGRNYER